MERNANYNMGGCTHSICKSCAFTMSLDEKTHVSPFGEYIEIDVVLYQLTCPLCRAVEPYPISPFYRKCLNEEYKESYRIWFETELFKNHRGSMYYTSHRKQNMRILPYEENDIQSLIHRVPYGPRTTALYLDDHNLYTDSSYFMILVYEVYPTCFYPIHVKRNPVFSYYLKG